MKRILTTTALVLLTGTAAIADTDSQLKASVESQLASRQLDVNVDALTADQLSELSLALNSGQSQAEIQRDVEQIAGVAGDDDASHQREALKASLMQRQLDVDVDTLTNEQVASLNLALNSGESQAEIRRQIDSVLNVSGETDADNLRAGLENTLATYQIDIDVDALSDQDVAELSNVFNSGASQAEINRRVDSIVAN
ncbi:hypothetical protein [Actibacterium sp. 188UL27-1]|uniref:hypothetical protein n=1 Tax=Actibacterium sp. 188UL27-1 TaxID=2786961 RepID=UPI00195EFC10|nr:hypothetical protein [Actibacterium sp. 188UL27-1]MBM7069450.1 hypothetical protein [Actibacterium sp. 188UL27-1]